MSAVSLAHPRLRAEVRPTRSTSSEDTATPSRSGSPASFTSCISPASSTAPLLPRAPALLGADGHAVPSGARAPLWARRQAHGAYAGFFTFGAGYAGFEARMPTLKRRLGLDNRTLGVLMGAMAIAQLAGSWVTEPLTRAIGPRSSQSLMAMTFPLAIAALAAGSSALEAVPAMVVIGASGGLYDNLINTAASVAEEGGVLSAMSTAHGLASVGGLVGGGSAAAAEDVALPLPVHLLTVGLALALMGLWAAQQVRTEYPGPVDTDELAEGSFAAAMPADGQVDRGASLTRSGAAYRLTLINLASSLAEGALYEWTSIYLRETLGASPAVAASGYVVVVASMAATRLLVSPRLLHAPLRRVLVGSSTLAGISMGATLLVGRREVALVGLGGTGAGLAIITPRIALEMGRRFPEQRNRAMAWLSSGQACGFFSGPPLIGLLAGRFGLERGLLVVPALAGVAALLSLPALGPSRRGPSAPNRAHAHQSGAA